ncbi:MAG: hypothetical protein L3J31_07540 [Bacteroidales bacterium]|nr:hypothetical protein [Bacteroidales bacterium]MCF6342639.1 hypothetical protein [Bacteroidales bacterium]
MKTTDINTSLIESYFGLTKNLSPEIKLDLIEKLTKTLKGKLTEKKNSVKKAFGAWESDISADEIIAELRTARHFSRQVEVM